MTDNAIRPFRVNVPEAELTELRQRIKNMARIGARLATFCRDLH